MRDKPFKADAKLGFVVNALYTMALGLHSLQKAVCGDTPGICPGLLPINGTLFMDHLLNVSFDTYSGLELRFDRKGDPPGR